MKNHSKLFVTAFTILIMLAILCNAIPTSSAYAESLTAPLQASGDFIWTNQTGGVGTDLGTGIATDSAGNVYTTGAFQNTVDFDPGAGISNITSIGTSDIFISKSDANGNFIWAKNMGGTQSAIANSLTIDSNGNLYITGNFSGVVDFDPGAGVSNLTSVGDNDVFVAKLNNNGNLVWAKNMGGASGDVGNSIAVDLAGNVYTIGFFSGDSDFNPGGGTAILSGAGGLDTFISKLDINGNFVWANRIGGTGYEYGMGIVLDSSSNVYITGDFQGTVDFDPGAGIANLTSMGGSDIFVSKLDTNGIFVWAKSMGGTGTDRGSKGIALDSNANIYTTGSFYGTADFDPGPGTINLIATGTGVFVSKLDGNGDLIWAKGMGNNSGVDVTVDINGDIYTTGFFQSTVDFDPGLNTFDLNGAGLGEIFVLKLDSSGNFVWAKSMGGSGLDTGLSIALGPNGNIYTTGYFEGTADFDPGAGTYNRISNGDSDIFVSKFEQAVPIFSDVLFNYWANSYIERLFNAGITGGCGTGIYCPDSTVTRAQMAIFLLKGMHGPSYTPPALGGSTGFGDVAIDYWAAAWIKELAAENITSGCGNGNYCPDTTVTRDQMSIFLLKAKHGSSYSPPNATGIFTDVPLGYWADKWIEQLATEGITGGCGAGVYCPASSVTRAQMAVFLVKAFNLP